MNKKALPSKTINPLHFEDLEPHRFEDLVRQLIYDFKDWQSIEATGRAGSDEGFDIRAWEKVSQVANKDDEEDAEDNGVGIHLMEGNLWMVQCKREQALGPTKVVKIIEDGIKEEVPYGYVLVASANFSKKSYDAFRDALREKGVKEFYLWRKAELEDLLYQPKNDRILFTFFGFSLVTKRRTKSVERKFAINNKNKLARVLNNGIQTQNFYGSVLIRDINDGKYPYEDKCENFDLNPKWEEEVVFQFDPRGLAMHLHKYYAYLDEKKKEFDFTDTIDLIFKPKELQRSTEAGDREKQNKVLDFWHHLHKNMQVFHAVDGLLLFEDILVIDEKGDAYYDIPHIFVDPRPDIKSLFRLGNGLVVDDELSYFHKNEYKRVTIFPTVFPDIKYGKVYKEKTVEWNADTLHVFNSLHDEFAYLFDVDGKYDFLNVNDAIFVSGGGKIGDSEAYIRITNKYQSTVKALMEIRGVRTSKNAIELQVGKKLEDSDLVNVFEFERAYGWNLKSYTKESICYS